jgi:hypothetical protein
MEPIIPDPNPNGLHGRDGKNGRNGRDGMDGLPGPTGSTGATGAQGPAGPPGRASPTAGQGLDDTATFSFVNERGEPGRQLTATAELVNLIQRKYQPLTYIGFIWSSPDTVTGYTVDVKDVSNKVILTFTVPPSPVPNVKNVFEIYTNPALTTLFTRLLKMCITLNPPGERVTFFTLMVGFN